MAEILFVPHHVSAEGTRRLADALTVMIEEGRELGSRRAQIHSLGLSIDTLVRALRAELDKLGLAKDLEVLTDRLEHLATLAGSYQVDEPS